MALRLIPMSFDVNYLEGWSSEDGGREIVQNMIDAANDTGIPYVFEHVGTTLRCKNPGARMGRDVLLVGTTSKKNRADQIGKWGEGLKFGAMAIVRQKDEHGRRHRTVRVRTQDETWTASIRQHPDFNAEVLTWMVTSSPAFDGVEVEITGVDQKEYGAIRSMFLDLSPAKVSVNTSYGSILKDPARRGKVYVKGVYVGSDERLQHGYNIENPSIVDRDRKMVRDSEMLYYVALIWQEAFLAGKVTADATLLLLRNGVKDVQYFDHWHYDARRKLANEWQIRNGKESTPVISQGDASDLGHFGEKGVVVNRETLEVFRGILETASDKKKKFSKLPKKLWVANQIGGDLFKNFLWAADVLEAVTGQAIMSRVDIVDFHDCNLDGLWLGRGEKVQIAKRLLTNRFKVLGTIIHEYAHDFGRDGEKEHVSKIEELWEKCAEHIANME